MQSIQRHLGILVLLITFVMQGLVSSGHGLMIKAHAAPMDMKAMSPSTMTQMHNCNDTDTPQCCDGMATKVLPDVSSHHCCNSKGMCQAKCQCIVASVMGLLVSSERWAANSLPEAAVATPMPHFISVALHPAFKPPKA